jgi:hypothetical protein
MTTNDVLHAIYDTREPEGDGKPMSDEHGPILFDRPQLAASFLASEGIDPSRVIVAPFDPED